MNELWFNHPEGLANLAAAVSQGKTPTQAVRYALKLCSESIKALERIALEEGAAPGLGYYPFGTELVMERVKKMEQWEKNVPKAENHPATLNDFFDVIINAKTPSDCTKRMRDFLAEIYFSNSQDPQSAAAAQIQRIKDGDEKGGFFTPLRWRIMGGCYLEWWKARKSDQSRQNATQRKKTKRVI